MNLYYVVSFIAFAAWVIVAFVVAWPSGWAHLPLVLAVILLARAIVHEPDERPTP